MSSIFGGSKSKQTSTSSNQAYDSINSALSPTLGYAQTGGDALSKLLGGDSSGFDAYKKATGFNAMAQEGSQGITGNAAAGGLLRSGSTAKGLQKYGQNLQDQSSGNYINQLLSLAGLGTNAAGIISGAGSTSNTSGTSSSKPGIGGFLGTVAKGAALSQRDVKENIKELYTLDNGLKVYSFRYIGETGNHIGVMADEVATLLPEALGPVIDGIQSVDYTKIGGF